MLLRRATRALETRPHELPDLATWFQIRSADGVRGDGEAVRLNDAVLLINYRDGRYVHLSTIDGKREVGGNAALRPCFNFDIIVALVLAVPGP